MSADGRNLLSGSLDGTARLWDLESGDEVAFYAGHDGPVYAVAFTGDGRILTGGNDRTIRVWPVTQGDSAVLVPGAAD